MRRLCLQCHKDYEVRGRNILDPSDNVCSLDCLYYHIRSLASQIDLPITVLNQSNPQFRSSWEVDVSVWLDSNFCNVLYEPAAIRLSNGKTYIPDFLAVVSDGRGCFVEVKGGRFRMRKVLLLSEVAPVVVIGKRLVTLVRKR